MNKQINYQYAGFDKIGGTGYGGGVIFSFDPSATIYTKLKDCDGINSANSFGAQGLFR